MMKPKKQRSFYELAARDAREIIAKRRVDDAFNKGKTDRLKGEHPFCPYQDPTLQTAYWDGYYL